MDLSSLSDAELERLKEMVKNKDPLLELINKESAFKGDAKSPKGAHGWTQFIPATERQMEKELGRDLDMTNLVDATDAARHYLTKLNKRFNGDWAKTLAAYNAGPTAVVQANGIPNIKETQDYVNTLAPHFKDFKGWGTAPSKPMNMMAMKSEETPGMEEPPMQEEPEGTDLRSMTDEQLMALKAKMQSANPTPDLTSKPTQERDYDALFNQAQKGRWKDVLYGVGGSIGGTVAGSAVTGPAAPAGGIVGGVLGGVVGTLGGMYENIRAAQEAGELPKDIPDDKLVEYLAKEAVYTAGLDVALLGTGKAVGPVFKAFIRKFPISETAAAKGINNFLEKYRAGSQWRAGMGDQAERATEVYRQAGIKIEDEIKASLDGFTNQLQKMRNPEDVQTVLRNGKKELSDKYGKVFEGLREGTPLGNVPVPVTSDGISEMFKAATTAIRQHKEMLKQGGKLLEADELKPLEHMIGRIAKGDYTVGELRTLKKIMQELTTFAPEGKLVSNDFANRTSKDVIVGIDKAIGEALVGAGEAGAAGKYALANKAYSEALAAYGSGAAKKMLSTDARLWAGRIAKSGSPKEVAESRSVLNALIREGQIPKEAAEQFDGELKRQWIIENVEKMTNADKVYQALSAKSVGAYDPEVRAMFNEVFGSSLPGTKKMVLEHLRAQHNLVEWARTLPEAQGLGAGRVGFIAIASSIIGGMLAGGTGAGIGAAAGQSAVYHLWTRLPRLAAEAAVRNDAKALNELKFFGRWMNHYIDGLKNTGATGMALTSSMTPVVKKVVNHLMEWDQEHSSDSSGADPRAAFSQGSTENDPRQAFQR